jgi:hypothetical protein
MDTIDIRLYRSLMSYDTKNWRCAMTNIVPLHSRVSDEEIRNFLREHRARSFKKPELARRLAEARIKAGLPNTPEIIEELTAQILAELERIQLRRISGVRRIKLP